MNFKKLLLLALLACPSAFIKAENQAAQPAFNQEQFASMMNHMYEVMMPEFKKVYKKYFDEIEWLDHYYVTNTQTGDAFIVGIAQEFAAILELKIDEFTGVMFDEIERAHGVVASAEEKAMFNAMMLQVMPTAMVQGLKKNAELKSSVYQEVLAERK